MWQTAVFGRAVTDCCVWMRCDRQLCLDELWQTVVFGWDVTDCCVWTSCDRLLCLDEMWQTAVFGRAVTDCCVWMRCDRQLCLDELWQTAVFGWDVTDCCVCQRRWVVRFRSLWCSRRRNRRSCGGRRGTRHRRNFRRRFDSVLCHPQNPKVHLPLVPRSCATPRIQRYTYL